MSIFKQANSRKSTWILFFVICLICCCLNCKQGSKDIKLVVDDSAIRYVLNDIDRAKTNKADIYKRFRGYQMQLNWVNDKDNTSLKSVNESNFLSDYFIKESNSYKSDSTKIYDVLKNTNDLSDLVKKYQFKISEHIHSYSTIKSGFTAKIHLVVFTPVNGTARNTDMMVRMEPNRNAAYILNLVIHETFHLCQGINYWFYSRYYLTLNKKRRYLMKIYHDIKFEGLATWVGYKSIEFIPITYTGQSMHDLPGYDYFSLERDSCVKKAIHQINGLIQAVNYKSIDSLNSESWDVGVMQRAYYIAGAYMSKTIEEKYGRNHLSHLVNRNENFFIKEYNDSIPEDFKIKFIE
jgi:hypothetical protein